MATRRKQDNTKRPNGTRQPLTPGELYHHEKRRRAGKTPASDLLAEAERAYKDMLAAEAEAGRGGRPKKNKQKPKEEDEDLPGDE